MVFLFNFVWKYYYAKYEMEWNGFRQATESYETFPKKKKEEYVYCYELCWLLT